MKKLFFVSIFLSLFLSSLASATILDSCDNLNPGNGDWNVIDDYGGSLGSTLNLNSSINIEGSACIEVFMTDQSWNSWSHKMYRPQGWDLSQEPILKFRLYPVGNINVNADGGLTFSIITGDPDTWGWNMYNYNLPVLVANQWNEIEIDLRMDRDGSPLSEQALSMVERLTLSISQHYGTSHEFYIDWIESLPGPSIPKGNILFTVTSDASPVEDVSIQVGGTIIDTDVNGMATFSDFFVGDYTTNIQKIGYESILPFTVNVLEDQTSQYSINLEKLPSFYFLPASKLHVEGKHIKDEYGNVVYLRGVNSPGFNDIPGGWWTNYNRWEPVEIRAHMRSMKSWGMNAVRMFIQPKWWMQDNVDFDGRSYTTRQHIRDTIQIAQEEGIYAIIVGGWGVVPINEPGHKQTEIPFPPYLTPEEEAILPSEQAFVNYYLSVIDGLKDRPNVIFELWNEPVGNDQSRDDWFRITQQVITSARQITDHPILIHWNYGIYANLDYGGGSKLDWIENYPLNDPMNNLIYSTHIYRWGGFCHRSDSVPAEDRNRWEYNEIELCLNTTLVNYVINDLEKPLVIGEIGAVLNDDRGHEYFENVLDIFNRWGISYLAWWWRPDGIFGLIDGRSTRNPNSVGHLLIKAVANGGIYAINFTKDVRDENNNIIGTNVTIERKDKTYDLFQNRHSLITPSIYNVSYILPNTLVKIVSVNLTKTNHNKLFMVNLKENRKSFFFDSYETQLVKINSNEKPTRLLKNNTVLQEYENSNDLGLNLGWYYDSVNKIIFMRI